jgi:hypothetical protein
MIAFPVASPYQSLSKNSYASATLPEKINLHQVYFIKY